MAKHAGAYRSDKRKKELARLKKQEEKRLRRQKKSESPSVDSAIQDQGLLPQDSGERAEDTASGEPGDQSPV